MSLNYKELGEYVVIRKTEFEKLKEAYRQYQHKKEFSKNYMRKKYNEQKTKKAQESEQNKMNDIDLEESDILFQLEHVS